MFKLLLFFCLVVEIWSGKGKKNRSGRNHKSGRGERANLEPALTIDAEITINAKSVTGETHTFVMRTTDNVKHLKELIQEKTGIDHRQQKIIQGIDVRGNGYRFERDSDVTYINDSTEFIIK